MKPLKNSEGTSLFEPPQRVSNTPWGSILPIPGSLQIKNYHQSSKKNRYNTSRKARGLWKLKTTPKRWFCMNFVLWWKNKGPVSFLLFFSATKVPYDLRAESMVQSEKVSFLDFLSIWVTIFFCCYKEKMGTNKHLRVVSK